MIDEKFLKGNIKTLWKNTSFRNAQNRAYFYGEHVTILKGKNKWVEGIVDGYGYDSANRNKYHIKDIGWVNTKYIYPGVIGAKREYTTPLNLNSKYIEFVNFPAYLDKIDNKDFLKAIIISKSDFYSDSHHLINNHYPVGKCEDDDYKNGDKVKIFAPGLFCDGMTGWVADGKYNAGMYVPMDKKYEVAVVFDLPNTDTYAYSHEGVNNQIFIVPKMYVKKISKIQFENIDKNVSKQKTNDVKMEKTTNEQLPKAELTACNYTFTGHMYKKILAKLAKELDKHNLYALSIAYVLSILKYKSTECKNGDMNIYIGDDKEGELFFISLQLIEEKLKYPITRYFELAKLGPIE